MSFADELREAERRMKALKDQESTKKKTGKGGARKGRAQVWTRDDEVIAFFLMRSQSTKFIKENYAKKRKISARAMSMRMALFESMVKGNATKEISPQTQGVFDEFATMEIQQMKDTVIDILRAGHPKVVEEEPI